MKLTEELFPKYTLIEEALLPYGFEKNGDSYFYHYPIRNGEFDLRIAVTNGKIDAKLIETVFGDEYTLINAETSGSFVASLKEECGKVLLDVRNKCFKEERFVFPQTNRIAGLIKEKYGVLPETMKFGSATNTVFRNPSTRKWIGLVMYSKRSNVTGEAGDGKVECLSLNFKEDAALYDQNGIYHPYKKQNRRWIVIILDDTLSDREIMDLVHIGYENSCR